MKANSRRLCVIFVLLCFVVIVGCDEITNQTKPSRPAPIVLSASSRFQSVGGGYGLALDTKTGELCHTYNEAVDTYVPATGTFRITGTAGHPSLDSIPLCIDLSQNEAATVKQILDANQKARDSAPASSGFDSNKYR